MSKAILILDMPESCDVCPLFLGHYSDMTCRAKHKTIDYPYPKDFRQSWCPLYEVPQKQNETYPLTRLNNGVVETYGVGKDSVVVGWNKCIDEILKRGERCSGCEYRHIVHANGGFNFYGCYCSPYTGKRVSEIKDCPKGDRENE